MAFFVFIVALVNVALGFALAVWLGRESLPQDELEIISALVARDPREVMEQHTPLPPTEGTHSAPLPNEWLALVDDIARHDAFAAAAIPLFKLSVADYRDQLVAVECAVLRHRHGVGERPIGEVVDKLKDVNARWFDSMSHALEHLHNAADPLGDLGHLRCGLELVLEEQAAQIETVTSNLATVDLAADVSDGCPQLLAEIGKLLAMIHRVRDSIHEVLTQMFVHAKQLDSISQKLLVDPLTGLYGRTGLEAVTWEWWRDDPTRQRPVSIVMLDIDAFAEVNKKYGTVASDQLLFAFAQLLRNTIRDARGYDVATRYSGQRFVLFFGDTGPRNAVSAAERIRRVVEESELKLNETTVRLTVSGGVTPILPSDTTISLMARAAGALDEAKRSGRNTTRIDEGDGPCEMHTPELNASGRTVLLEV